MKLWKINEDVNNFLSVILKENESIRKFSKIFDGHKSLVNEWVQKEVNFFDEKGGKKKGDFFYMTSGIHVLSERACYVFQEFIKDYNAELLPLLVNEEKLFALNPLKFIDCIDLDKSIVEYFPNSNRVLAIKKYYFKMDAIGNEDIFKAIQQPFGPIFISNRLKEKLEQSEILGAKFDEIWDSEKESYR